MNDCTPVSSYWSMIDFQVVKMAWMGKKKSQSNNEELSEIGNTIACTHTHTLENCNLRTYKVGI